jgi:prepilin-type N-terminal cleavage/methylation domain-containing protein
MTYNNHRRVRRGFTIIELLIGIVIFGIIGALCTQLITTQGRWFDRQGMGNAARNVSRASLNRVVSDFRMIEAGGAVVAASSTSLTIRVPFAIGVMCGNPNTSETSVSILPVDSMTYSKSPFYGYAWRNYQTGKYSYVESPASRSTADAGEIAVCTNVNVTTVPGGKVIVLSPMLPTGSGLAGLGTPVFLYSMIRYEFKTSTAVPGKIGLYRTSIAPGGGETAEELVAPFANTANWKFFVVNGGTVAQTNPPAVLSDIRGLELHLDGNSEAIAATKTLSESAPFTTAVFFKNRVN